MNSSRNDIITKLLQVGGRFAGSELLQTLNQGTDQLLELAHMDFVPVSHHLQDIYKKAKLVFQDHMDQEREARYMSNMGTLIIDLQIHDKIRQKLEHIHHVHDVMLGEVETFLKTEKLESSRFLGVCPEICHLHIAQLDFLESEYKETTTMLSGALRGIMNDDELSTAVGLSESLAFNHSDEFILEANNMISLYHNMTMGDFSQVKDPEVEQKLMTIFDLYTMQDERDVFNKVFFPDKVSVEVEDEMDIELF